MHKDNEKLIIFRELIKIFSENESLKEIQEDIILKGNLAYFIDRYIDTEEWNKLYVNIVNGVKADAINDICYMLYNKIQIKKLEELSEKTTISKMKVIKDMYVEMSSTFKLQYEEKRLKNFTVIGAKSYPDWYLVYEKFLQDAKR